MERGHPVTGRVKPPSSIVLTARSFLNDLSSHICLSLTLAAGREPLLTVTDWGAKYHTTGTHLRAHLQHKAPSTPDFYPSRSQMSLREVMLNICYLLNCFLLTDTVWPQGHQAQCSHMSCSTGLRSEAPCISWLCLK